ncbi:hypothetical protein R5R35_002810 [Gryllus longicercus]|uniref:Uncharacterized protein n=1 Tax=Gryllus longicercus TaxID=2509291 RepID=A0AAN9V313_9ORTH
MVIAPGPPAADFAAPEGSGAPPDSAADDMMARFQAFRLHGGRTVTARRDRDPVYAVLKEHAQVADFKRKSKLLRMLPTSSEQYRHMLPIIGGEQDQEIPFSQVRVRGID